MRLIRSRAIDGVAVQSLTITYLSPMITPELGSPSAVYAQQWGDSCSKVIFLSARSAWLANALFMGLLLARSGEGPILLSVMRYALLNRSAARQKPPPPAGRRAGWRRQRARAAPTAGPPAPRTGWPPGWADRNGRSAPPRAPVPGAA